MATKESWSAHYGEVFAFPKNNGVSILPITGVISWELCREIAMGKADKLLKGKITEDLKMQLMVVAKMALSAHEFRLK